MLVFGLFFFLYLLSGDGSGDASGTFDSFGVLGGTNLRTKVIRSGSSGTDSIALVCVQGTIDGDGSPLEGTGMLSFVSEQIRAAAEDSSVKAVVLQVDSPGGGLSASDQLHNEVVNLRSKGKKVIAWAGGMMASGGYYIAVGAEGIMASPTATVGSIGVVMQHIQVKDLMTKLGIKVDPITTGEHKDMGSIFRDMTPEERRYLQSYVDVSHERFVDLVAQGRGMTRDKVAVLATGKIFNADDALASGLVDKIGYIDDALRWTEELIGRSDMRVISYRRPMGFGDLFREAGHGAAAAALELDAAPTVPRPMAVWEGR